MDYTMFRNEITSLQKESVNTDVSSQFSSINNTITTRGKISGDESLYVEIQNLVTILKTDFFNALNITDGDGISDGD